MTKLSVIRGIVLSGALALAACGDDTDVTDPGTGSGGPGETGRANIVDTAVEAGSFTVLAQALVDTGLATTLSGEGPFTVFAPTDEAFAALPEGTLESLSMDDLTAILSYHVVAGEALAADLDGAPLETSQGLTLFVDVSDGVSVNGSQVTQADVGASNGVIHVIDEVLLPPNLVEAAILAGSFGTLTGALSEAELVETLAGPGPFTVFAPTDDAFAALPEGTLENMDKETLTQVLTYHVVPGSVLSGELSSGALPTALEGQELGVSLEGGVSINGANVVLADVVTTNGVIHVIDEVLIPGS